MSERRVLVPVLLSVALLVGAAGWLAADGQSRPLPGEIGTGSFHSASLAATLHYAIALPPGYTDDPSRRYPVIYFLHGLPASTNAYLSVGWLARKLDEAGDGAILVAPQGTLTDGADPEYHDWGLGRNWASALAVDLPRFVDSHYRTIANRAGRALIGMSAGGYGAASIGTSHLDTFSVIESWSGYFQPTDPTGRHVRDVGTDADNAAASLHQQAMSLATRFRRLKTFFAFYVGRSDPTFVGENRRMDEELRDARVPHLFATYAGAHTHALWAAHATAWLRLALRHLAAPVTMGRLTSATRSAVPRWTLIGHGVRQGTLWRETAPVPDGAELYLPPRAIPGRAYRLVDVLGSVSPAAIADRSGLLDVADSLIWNGTTPPFAGLMLRAAPGTEAAVAASWDGVTLPVGRLGRPRLVTVGADGASLSDELSSVLTTAAVQGAEVGAEHVLPHGWVRIVAGPAGGTVWQGVIPDTVVPGAHRASLVYLPPSTSATRHYPVVYLLHGLRGSPYSFVGGMRLAAIADDLIRTHRAPPFVAVLPPAGRSIEYDGEWAGPWERYVVDDVVPWARSHLPIHPQAAHATIAGLSAGGYGALDIGLRHPALFGTLVSFSGYYRAPHDGPLTGASPALLAANDPTALVRRQAPLLRSRGLRISLACGEREHRLLARTRAFAGVLARAGIIHRVVETPGGHTGSTWRHQLSDALRFALSR